MLSNCASVMMTLLSFTSIIDLICIRCRSRVQNIFLSLRSQEELWSFGLVTERMLSNCAFFMKTSLMFTSVNVSIDIYAVVRVCRTFLSLTRLEDHTKSHGDLG